MHSNNPIWSIVATFLFLFLFVNSALAQTTAHTYDTLGRLTFVTDPNGNRDYDYDEVGNRTEVAVGAATDDPPVAPVLPAPVLLTGACSQVAPGVYKG